PAGRAALDDGTKLTPGQRAALERLERDGQARVAELGGDMARRLERRGLVSVDAQTELRRPARHEIGAASGLRRPVLTDEQARVCVGPRSAVFAPLNDIGLIVVDEEHEGSYKNEGDPRYDARLVAERRAREHGAVLVLGSATPRPESAHSLPRLLLRDRVDR